MSTQAKFKKRFWLQLLDRLAMQTALLYLIWGQLKSQAQTFTMLHSFIANDGTHPWAALVLSGATLYGTASAGGSNDMGTVFKLNTDGKGFSVLKYFSYWDGVHPYGALVLFGNALFGTTCDGGRYNYGTVFKLNTDGSGYAVLAHLGGAGEAANPYAGLILDGSRLYGTSAWNGSGGSVFGVNNDGSACEAVCFFGADYGAGAYGRLLSAGYLYGTAANYGKYNLGTVFRVSPSTIRGLPTVLKHFTGYDGACPRSELLLLGSDLFGTTVSGGTASRGVIFRLNLNGGSYSVLKSFAGGSDGAYPWGGLLLSGTNLYGTTREGGSAANGLLFRLAVDGRGYTPLKHFHGNDGANPSATLIVSGPNLFGTTQNGGTASNGVVFSLALVPPVIRTPLQSQTAESGSRICFRPDIEQAPTLTYRWFFNETNSLTEATAQADLVLTNLEFYQSGGYTVVVSNLFGLTTSGPALLNVITPIVRRTVPALTLKGQPGTSLNLEFSTALGSVSHWATFDQATLTQSSQWYFDVVTPLQAQGFYRTRQSVGSGKVAILGLDMVPALTLTGAIGSSVRIDCINQVGPIDAWTDLATVTLTNTSQLYFDTSSIGQPPRLWRLVPVQSTTAKSAP